MILLGLILLLFQKDYGFKAPADPNYKKAQKTAFKNITQDKKTYFTWPMYKKFLTEVDVEVEKDDKKKQ